MTDTVPNESHEPIEPIERTIVVAGGDVAAAARNRNGLTYKGFGVLSGNATSSMLADYRAERPEAYHGLVERLFGGERPMMTTVKVEMGNDRNNSTGPNPATMREPGEYPAVEREPGFLLAADARRLNPALHVSVLRWQTPTWVHTNDDVYRWYKNTILACHRRYGFMVDSVNPDVNERTPDLDWVAEFARRVRTDETGFEVDADAPATPADAEAAAAACALPCSEGGRPATQADAGWASDEERELFHRIKVITSDEEVTGTFAGQLLDTPRYLDAVDVAAYHYSVVDDDQGGFTRLADVEDKEVWNSEAQAVFSNSADRPNNTNGTGLDGDGGGTASTGIGGIGSPLEMANTLIKAFVRSRRTLTIYQPAIGACGEQMEYASKELLSMRDPWSGWLYYDAGCAVLEHLAKFARLGWEAADTADPAAGGIWRAIPAASASDVTGSNPVSGARHGEASYLTLAAPDGSDVSVVIVNDSSLPVTYRIRIDPALAAAGKPLEVWRTRAAEPGERYDAQWRRHIGRAGVSAGGPDSDGVPEVVVEPWSMATVTTLTDVEPYALPACAEGSRAVLDEDPAAGVLFADDYARADAAEGIVSPRYATCSNGAFEIVADPDRGHALRQQIDWTHAGDAWIEGEPRLTVGDMRWANYRVSVDVRFEAWPGRAPYVLLGARDLGGDKFTTDICGYDVKLRADGFWLLRSHGVERRRGHFEDLRRAAARAGAEPFPLDSTGWFTLTLEVAGPTVRASVNGAMFAEWTDPAPTSAGRVDLGTSFDHVRFANLRVERVDGFSPAYTALIDDMHLVSWDDSATPVLQYGGSWTHRNGQGMFTYLRTISETRDPGATLTHTFTGTGLDVFGPSDGTARLDVIVDGSVVDQARPVWATDRSLATQLRVEGLPAGRHTVTLRLANRADWRVDAIGTLA